MFEQVLQQIVVVAVFVERLVNFVKLTKYDEWAQKYQKYIDIGLTLLFNVGLCYAWSIDVFAVADIVVASFPAAGSLLTGVLAGLGSEIIHEVVELLKLWRQGPKPPEFG